MRSKKTGKLVSKDILDINMDMSVVELNGKYYVKVTRDYLLDEEFTTPQDAEEQLKAISLARNSIENELRMYC